MSKTDAKRKADTSPSEPATTMAATTRVDAAHVVAKEVAEAAQPPVNEPAAGTDPADPGILAEQVRAQAAQLAAHLRRQQQELDHREAELNARIAAVETEVRGARLWLSERQEELAERRADVDRRERELEARLAQQTNTEQQQQNEQSIAEADLRHRSAELATREEVLARRIASLASAQSNWKDLQDEERAQASRFREELAQREAELLERAQALDHRQQELDVAAKQLAAQIRLGEQAEQLQAVVKQHESRREHLDAAEALVARQQAELDELRRDLEFERERLAEQAREDRRKVAEHQRDVEGELERKKQQLKRRSDELDARKTALKQLRAEVSRTQRETLEMRLATEELWARLCGTMAPAALTQSLSQIRLQIAEHNRMAQVEIAEQKTELQGLAVRLAEQHENLGRQKQELQDWAVRRQAEIEQQAARLVAREQELDGQETSFKESERKWREERQAQQREISRLLRQLRRTGAAV